MRAISVSLSIAHVGLGTWNKSFIMIFMFTGIRGSQEIVQRSVALYSINFFMYQPFKFFTVLNCDAKLLSILLLYNISTYLNRSSSNSVYNLGENATTMWLLPP